MRDLEDGCFLLVVLNFRLNFGGAILGCATFLVCAIVYFYAGASAGAGAGFECVSHLGGVVIEILTVVFCSVGKFCGWLACLGTPI